MYETLRSTIDQSPTLYVSVPLLLLLVQLAALAQARRLSTLQCPHPRGASQHSSVTCCPC